jgi:S1-C subfamily serine protease
MGSGTVIKKTTDAIYILTCYHVIAEMSENPEFEISTGKFLISKRIFIAFDIEKNKRTFYSADVVAIDKKVDLGLLKIKPIPHGINAVKLAVNEPEVGDEVIVVGNPLGEIRNYSKQYITNKEKIFYVTNGLLTFGNSGGGLFNRFGDLIGVPESVRMSPVYGSRGDVYWGAESSIGFSVDLPTIKKFLKENKFEYIY